MYYAKKYYAKRSIQYRVPHSARRNHNYSCFDFLWTPTKYQGDYCFRHNKESFGYQII